MWGPLRCPSPVWLQFWTSLDFEQLHLKHEGCTTWNLWGSSPLSIPQLWWNHQLPFFSLTHPQQPLVPALDDLACAQGEDKGLVLGQAAVKFCPIFQLPRVVHVQDVTLARFDGTVVYPLLDPDLQLPFALGPRSSGQGAQADGQYCQNPAQPWKTSVRILIHFIFGYWSHFYFRGHCLLTITAKQGQRKDSDRSMK